MNLPKKENLVLDHRYWTGSFKDFSGNGNDGIPTGVYFEKTPKKGVKFSPPAYIKVPDSPELNLNDELTIIVYAKFGLTTSGTEDRMVIKRSTPGNFDFKHTSSQIKLYANVVNSVVNLNIDGAKSVAVTCKTGEKPSFYRDGVYKGIGNVALNLASDSADVYIGSFLGGTNEFQFPMHGVLIYNKVLTDAEIAQIHEWIMNTKSPSYSKKHLIYSTQVTGRENGVIAAWEMKNEHGKIIDKSGNGYNGDITNTTQTKDGLYFNANSYINIATSPLSTHSDFSFEGVIEPQSSTNSKIILSNGTSNDIAVLIAIDNLNRLQFQVEKTSDSTYVRAVKDISSMVGKLVHVIGTYESSTQTLKLYIDNDEIVAVYNTAYINPLGGTALTIGARNVDYSNGYLGGIKHIRLFDHVLSADERANYYKKYAKLPIFIDNLKDTNESVTDEGGAVGDYLSNTEWRFGDTTARYKISGASIDGNIIGSQLLTDGDMEASGTSDWTAGNSATLTKETTNPHGGSQVLRVAYSSVNNPFAYQAILTSGKTYRLRGYARSDGSKTPQVYLGTGSIDWVGSTSTDWQYFDVIAEADNANLALQSAGAGSGYCEFDDVTLYEVETDTKVIKCTTAGHLYQKSNYAFGTWEWKWRKASSTTIMNFAFVGQKYNDVGYGYRLRFDQNGAVALFRDGVRIMNTANNYVTFGVWYKIKITRKYDGQFTVYIKGGDYTNWTKVVADSGSNPVTDTTYTDAKYILFKGNQNDEITNFKFYNGILTT